MRNKIMTLDLEGDGLDAEINQKLFPTGNHQDPNTQIWCATLAFRDDNNKLNTETYVAKLPNHTREVKDGIMTKAYHEDTTYVPQRIWLNDHFIYSIYKQNNELELIRSLTSSLFNYYNMGYKIYCKGYGKYNYDYLAIYNSLNRIGDESLAKSFEKLFGNVIGMNNAAEEFPEINKLWKETSKQVKSGEWVDNQRYMSFGIKHNIEDAIQLLNILPKFVDQKNKLDSLNGDF